MFYKMNVFRGIKEVSQWFRLLDAVAEDWGSVSSMHMVSLDYL